MRKSPRAGSTLGATGVADNNDGSILFELSSNSQQCVTMREHPHLYHDSQQTFLAVYGKSAGVIDKMYFA